MRNLADVGYRYSQTPVYGKIGHTLASIPEMTEETVRIEAPVFRTANDYCAGDLLVYCKRVLVVLSDNKRSCFPREDCVLTSAKIGNDGIYLAKAEGTTFAKQGEQVYVDGAAAAAYDCENHKETKLVVYDEANKPPAAISIGTVGLPSHVDACGVYVRFRANEVPEHIADLPVKADPETEEECCDGFSDQLCEGELKSPKGDPDENPDGDGDTLPKGLL